MMHGMTPDDTVVSRLQYWSVTSPETPAFVYVTPDGERYAYSRKEFFSLSRRAASWLRHRGVGKKDVLLCLLPTSPEQTFTSLGATVLGATTMCAMIQYRDGSDIVPVINCGDVTTIVVDQTDRQAMTALENFIPNLSAGSVTSRVFPSVKTVIFCNRFPEESELSFLDSIAMEEEANVVDVGPDDVATIFMTSGTSGQPKLVPKTHRQVMAMAVQGSEIWSASGADVYYCIGSFGWVSGYPSDYCGFAKTRVIPYVKGSRPRDEEKFLWDLLMEEKVKIIVTSPMRLQGLLARADLLQSDVTWRAHSIIFGGSVIRKEFGSVLGPLTSKLLLFYGCTEVGIVAKKFYTGDSAEVQDFNCGKPGKDLQVKIVDDNLEEVPPYTKGEIIVKHNGIFSGYLKQPELTASATPEEGWFRPGDIGYMNDDGEVFVEGRRSEVISIGSWMMHPQPLESRLMERPGVHDVAVVAIPNKDFNNLPCVCVVQDPRPEAQRVVPDDILRTCAEYFQESFLRVSKDRESGVPKVCLVFDKFPVNVNGKVQRAVLRALALERLGLQTTVCQ